MISLVIGASGFLGSHLVDFLLARGDSVIAFQRKAPAAPARERLRLVQGDVLDAEAVFRAIKENAPQEIYHLAAQSLPNLSWDDPWLTHRINVGGTLNMLEGARAASMSPSIIVASSSSIYASSLDGFPIREAGECRPSSPYGVSKLAAEHLSRLYAERYGLRVLLARPFFLIGPRKTGDVCSDWARNIVAIERGASGTLAVGNLAVERDFLHVADGVTALATIAAKGMAGQAYNICSGRGWSLETLLDDLKGRARCEIGVRIDPARLRALDERIKIGDPSKLMALGWSEQRSVDVALEEILEYWRHQDPV